MALRSCDSVQRRRPAINAPERESACRFIEGLVCATFGVRPAALGAGSRGRARAALARQTAMYLAHVSLGLTLSEVGRRFGRDRTTVAHACARVEDGRENPRIERIVACLEAALQSWRASVFSEGGTE